MLCKPRQVTTLTIHSSKCFQFIDSFLLSLMISFNQPNTLTPIGVPVALTTGGTTEYNLIQIQAE